MTASVPPPLSSAFPANPHLQAEEVSDLLAAVKDLLIPFIQAGSNPLTSSPLGTPGTTTPTGKGKGEDAHPGGVVQSFPPEELRELLKLDTPAEGLGKDGMLALVQQTLRYSVNTWDQGFMDKLYASTNAVGVVSELVLAVLNTNVHVYGVSPVLTLVEKHVTRALADLIGFTSADGRQPGGVSQPGGSASNASSIIIARNTLFPSTKTEGLGPERYTLFTSAHGHYSVEKAAQMFGFGSSAVIPVPVDEVGRMISSELDRLVRESKARGEKPFYVNATAGTTVLGSFDPFEEISAVAREHGMWMHIDGSWGGSVVMSETYSKTRLRGMERADSMAITPHKMLGVPMTCSFLLVRDMRQTWEAMTLPAGYLFHNDGSEEVFDLADLTPQCGRRGDALKFYLSWIYYGTSGLGHIIDTGYAQSTYLQSLLLADAQGHFTLVSPDPLPCWQVCFYFNPHGVPVGGSEEERAKGNTENTVRVARELVGRGFMVDYAPGKEGKFLRVVVHANKTRGTCEALVRAMLEIGGGM